MTTTTRTTLDEFLAMPETEPASEFACGEVTQKPMPDAPHSFLQGYLWLVIYQFLAQTNLGRVGTEWCCVFGPAGKQRAFVPDVMYVSNERRTGHQQRAAPDLAVEILSPDQPAARFADKILFYLLHGVRLVWVVDPDARSITVFRPGEDARTLTSGDALDGDDVLPGFSVAVDDIFAQIDT